MCYISITPDNIETEHICCAFSDKKCKEGYALKKQWLRSAFQEDYSFLRLDERAKVFLEFGPAEKAWQPIVAPCYLALGCFWVSGKYKRNGYGKALLQRAIDQAKEQNKKGIVSVSGKKKFHFMNDTKWLLRQGFEVCDETSDGFALLALTLDKKAYLPSFCDCAKQGSIPNSKGVVVYYSNRCPFTEYHVRTSLVETVEKRNLDLEIIHIETMAAAQNSPTPATIFSLYYDGKFITTDVSVCMNSRFDKIVGKS